MLVDFTEYLVRDGNDIAGRLRPGPIASSATRSSIYPPMTLGFPKNTEMEAELTFVRQAGAAGAPAAGGAGGGGAAAARSSKGSAASRRPRKRRASASITRSSSCRTANYKPRRFDPRSGFGAMSFENYSALPGQPMTQRFTAPASAAEEGSVGARSASRSSRSSTTSIPARPSRSARRCSTARAGGTRRSRPPAIATRSASSSCPRA